MKHSASLPEGSVPWCERVSALVDGELGDAELSALLDALDREPDTAAAWGRYHVVGELVRGSVAGVALRHDEHFVQGVCDLITAEARAGLAHAGREGRTGAISPTAARRTPGGLAEPVTERLAEGGRPSANDAVWRWKIVAGISMLGMASVLGWHLAGTRATLAGPQLARVQAVPAAGGMVMIRDPQLDALIAAHQEQGGNSALQTPAGFVRNAAFERPAP